MGDYLRPCQTTFRILQVSFANCAHCQSAQVGQKNQYALPRGTQTDTLPLNSETLPHNAAAESVADNAAAQSTAQQQLWRNLLAQPYTRTDWFVSQVPDCAALPECVLLSSADLKVSATNSCIIGTCLCHQGLFSAAQLLPA